MENAEGQNALDLALRYQLVGPQSSLFLVVVRAGGDKSEVLPKLRQVDQMLVAGYGGLGSVMGSTCFAAVCSSVDAFGPFATKTVKKLPSPAYFKPMKSAGKKKYAQPTAKKITKAGETTFVLSGRIAAELLAEFDRQALASLNFSAIVSNMVQNPPMVDWPHPLADLIKNEGLDQDTAWAVMLSWLADKLASDQPLSRQARRLLRQALRSLDDSR